MNGFVGLSVDSVGILKNADMARKLRRFYVKYKNEITELTVRLLLQAGKQQTGVEAQRRVHVPKIW